MVLKKLEALYCVQLGFCTRQIVATGMEHFGFLHEHVGEDICFLFDRRCVWSVEA